MTAARVAPGDRSLTVDLVHRIYDEVGGSERDMVEIGRHLVGAGHEVHVHCARFRKEPDPQFLVHRLADTRLGRRRRYRCLLEGARAVPALGHDVVVGFGRTLGQDLYRCEGGTHLDYLEVMARHHGRRARPTAYDRMILDVERRLFTTDAPLLVVSLSGLVRDEIHRVYGFPRERIEVVTNGVDLARFHPARRDEWRARTRAELGVPRAAPLALLVGIGWERKGLSALLETLPSRPDLHVVVIGRDRDEARFRRRIRELGLAGRVHLVGPRTALERDYPAADVLVLASYQEAFGNVVLEALASGVPVVTARCVGAAELLTGELAMGVIEDPGDPGALGAAVDRMLARRADPRPLAARCRAAAEPHGLDAMGRRMESLVRAVADEKAARRRFDGVQGRG